MDRATHLLYKDAAYLAEDLAKEIRFAEKQAGIGGLVPGSLMPFAEIRLEAIRDLLKLIQKATT